MAGQYDKIMESLGYGGASGDGSGGSTRPSGGTMSKAFVGQSDWGAVKNSFEAWMQSMGFYHEKYDPYTRTTKPGNWPDGATLASLYQTFMSTQGETMAQQSSIQDASRKADEWQKSSGLLRSGDFVPGTNYRIP